jgi:hypothetical protein
MNRLWFVIGFFIIPIFLFSQTNPKNLGEKKGFHIFSNSKVSPNETKNPFQIIKRNKYLRYMYPEWSFDVGLGTSNSFTDIGGKDWAGKNLFTDVQMESTNLSFALFAEYRKQIRSGFGLTFYYGKITGSDAYSPNTSRSHRNNSFTNNIFELGIRHKIYLQPNKYYKYGWNYRGPLHYYIYYGLNGFFNNPQLHDPTGNYEPTKKISKIQVSIPLGIGIYYIFHNHYRFGFDTAYRLTFTDYIDGFTTHASNRRDSYFFTSFTLGYAFTKNNYKKRPVLPKTI